MPDAPAPILRQDMSAPVSGGNGTTIRLTLMGRKIEPVID
jgi:hypothetical protein